MTVGTKIKQLREKKGFSQPDLAFKLGISQGTLCNIESGDTKKIDFLLMDKICKEFDVDYEYFTSPVSLKQINRDKATGYLGHNQNFTVSDKLIEQYEERIKELKETIEILRNK